MGLCVYGVCRTGSIDPADLPTGLGGERVFAVCTERTTALMSSIETPLERANETDFEAFDRVVERAHAITATLPVRFGVYFSDDALLSRALRHAESRLMAGLVAVDGRAEVSVTLHPASRVVTRPARVADPAPVVAGFDGTGAIKAAATPVPAVPLRITPEDPAFVLRHRLAPLHAIAERVEIEDPIASSAGGVMRCLLRRERFDEFGVAFEELREEHGFDARLGAPSPCYHFMTQSLG